jgi:hypothetical protein
MIAIDGLASGQLSAKLASGSDGMIVLVAHGADERELEETRRLAHLLEVELIGFVYSRPKPPFWRSIGSKVGLGRHDHDHAPPPPAPPEPPRGERQLASPPASAELMS